MAKWGYKFNQTFSKAREEHAFLLRCEGLKYKEIGKQFGVSVERARQMTFRCSRHLNKAMRKTKVYYRR